MCMSFVILIIVADFQKDCPPPRLAITVRSFVIFSQASVLGMQILYTFRFVLHRKCSEALLQLGFVA